MTVFTIGPHEVETSNNIMRNVPVEDELVKRSSPRDGFNFSLFKEKIVVIMIVMN